MSTPLEVLTQINLDDLVAALGWQQSPRLARLFRYLFYAPARTFAAQILEFDRLIPQIGLPEAARRILPRYIHSLRVFGADRVPDSAFLALSNHPGMTDTLSLFAALQRPDLKIIALDRPFLNTLPNIHQRLFYVKDDPASRMGLVRQVAAYLRAGGAVLTFPAGHIEPDPAVYPGAIKSLTTWLDSASVFVRLAPQAVILPVLVRGVVWGKIARHGLLTIKKKGEEREKLAAALQLLAHVLFRQNEVDVQVFIGHPLTTQSLNFKNTERVHQAILAEMKQLMENPPTSEERVFLP